METAEIDAKSAEKKVAQQTGNTDGVSHDNGPLESDIAKRPLWQEYVRQAELFAWDGNARAVLEFELANMSSRQDFIKRAKFAGVTIQDQGVKGMESTHSDSHRPRSQESSSGSTISIPPELSKTTIKASTNSESAEDPVAETIPFKRSVLQKGPVISSLTPILLLLENKLRHEAKSLRHKRLRSLQRKIMSKPPHSPKSTDSKIFSGHRPSPTVFHGSKLIPLKLKPVTARARGISASRISEEPRPRNGAADELERPKEAASERSEENVSILFDAEDDTKTPSPSTAAPSNLVSFPPLTNKKTQRTVFKGPLDSIEEMSSTLLSVFDSGSFNPDYDIVTNTSNTSELFEDSTGEGNISSGDSEFDRKEESKEWLSVGGDLKLGNVGGGVRGSEPTTRVSVVTARGEMVKQGSPVESLRKLLRSVDK